MEIPKLYIGVKLVEAQPMNRAEYTVYRGWALPIDEKGEDEGYLIVYQDGGKPNHPNHIGYITWSPKEQFDNAYQVVTSKDAEIFLANLKQIIQEKGATNV